MSKKNCYYKDQFFNLLIPNADVLQEIRMKFIGPNGETNWMNLNKDSIAALKSFLKETEK